MDKQKDFEKGWEEYKVKSKQEIEELESAIYDNYSDDSKFMAEALYDAGYRRNPKNAVVLTREEHQKYLAFKLIEPQVRGCLDREQELEKQVHELDKELNLAKSVLSYDDERPLKKFAEHLRKETAEEFIKDLDYFIGHMKPSEYSLMEAILAINAEAYKIANKFGVYYEDET